MYCTGYREVSHGGGHSGFQSQLTMLPDMGIGTFLTSNTADLGFTRKIMSMFLQDILLDGESWLDVETACAILDSMANSNVLDSHPQARTLKG